MIKEGVRQAPILAEGIKPQMGSYHTKTSKKTGAQRDEIVREFSPGAAVVTPKSVRNVVASLEPSRDSNKCSSSYE